ncbi:MAG: hypothetical protein IIT36_02180 [Aeriscardovia sp.]|nr:hypothetical protein [Aeriscardovia sp.]
MKAWVTALTPLVVALLGVVTAYVRGKEADADGSSREGGAHLMASVIDSQNRILEQLDKLSDKVDDLEARMARLEQESKRGRRWV